MTDTRKKILIVINDENAIKIFQSVLEEYNYLVTTANSFQKLYELHIHQKYDVVILSNLGLPASSILECAIKLKQIDSQIKIIVVSGVNDSGFVESLIDAGVKYFYKLPVNMEELHFKIQELQTNK